MGCSNSMVFDFDKFNPFNFFKSNEDLNSKNETFEIRKENHKKIQSITDLIKNEELKEIAKNLLDKNSDVIISTLDKIWEKNEIKFKEISIDKKEFVKGFYNFFAEMLLERDFLKTNQNFIKIIESFIKEKDILTEFEYKITFEILNNPMMDLAFQERVITLFSHEEFDNEIISDKKIFLNLINKFNYDENTYPSAIYLHLNNQNLKSDIVSEFCEGISNNKKLTFVSIILNPFSYEQNTSKKYLYTLNPIMYKNLYRIIDAIRKNDNIKHFIFTSTLESQIILAPEISNLIINKLNSDTLFGFHIGKILISENTLKEIFNTLSNLNNLKYFCFDIRSYNNILIDCFKENLVRNKSIELLGIFGFKYPEKEFDQLKRDLKRNNYLKIIINKEYIDFK
jgi:hypothetical protein